MQFAAWDARMSTPDKSGSTPRDSWRALAKRGRLDAYTHLDGPAFPDSLGYLWEWSRDLRRGTGTDMNGKAPLSWIVLDAWARHSGNAPAPHEIDALFSLDAVMRHPDSLDEKEA